MNCRRIAAALLIVIVTGGSLAAQTAPEGPADQPGNAIEREPPAWARTLRRAEIVAFGSFPLTLLASRLVYSLIRFGVKSVQAGAIDTAYAPWFLAPPGAPELQLPEKVGVLGGAVGLSTIVALIDFRLGRAEEVEPE